MLTPERLRELLQELEGVEVTDDGRRMVAVVVSSAFEGINEGERQERVWLLLRKKLVTDDLRRVEFVMTDTPAERAETLAG